MNELHLFAGAGGGILASHLNGDRCIGAVEINPYAQQVLIARQEDGTLPPFPVFGDVLTFDAKPFRGRADVISAGFPCQDISSAGDRAGITGARSGLWKQVVRVVREVEPYQVRLENSADLTSRGLGVVLGDLAALGFNARWGVLSAAELGAHHIRERIWILATHADHHRAQRREQQPARHCKARRTTYAPWPAESGLVRMVHGVPSRLDRIYCLGNAQVPRVAAAAWRILSEAA